VTTTTTTSVPVGTFATVDRYGYPVTVQSSGDGHLRRVYRRRGVRPAVIATWTGREWQPVTDRHATTVAPINTNPGRARVSHGGPCPTCNRAVRDLRGHQCQGATR